MSENVTKTFHQLITVMMLVILVIASETMPDEPTTETEPYYHLANNYNLKKFSTEIDRHKRQWIGRNVVLPKSLFFSRIDK